MTRIARQNQEPTPEFFRDVIVALKLLFPQATVDRGLMMELAPYLVEQWRTGHDARAAVQSTCSCDGSKIFLSPGAQLKALPKTRRIALPPVNAKPGELFGAEDLRDPGPIVRLKVDAAVKRAKAMVRDKMAEIADQRAKSARSESAKNRAQLLYARYIHQRDVLAKEADALDAQLKEVLKGLALPKKPRKPKTDVAATVPTKPGPKPDTKSKPAVQPSPPPASKPATGPAAGTDVEGKLNAKARDLLESKGG